MNHKELVTHYIELYEAKNRQEQWAIDEAAKPLPKGHPGAFLEALGIKPLPDDHPLYKNATPFVIIGGGSRKKKVRQ